MRQTDTTDAQMPLAASVQALWRDQGRRIVELFAAAVAENGLSLHALADETGRDLAQVSRSLKIDSGTHMPPDLQAAILGKDRKLVVLRGLSAMAGCKAPAKEKRDPEREVERLRSVLRDLGMVLRRLEDDNL